LSLVVALQLSAGTDSFVGKWKLNASKSKLTDQMKIETAGANRYAITFAPSAIDTVVADGNDQPGLFGTTLSITVEGPDTWKVVRKRNGHMLLTGIWTLSEDGNMLSDAFTGYQADGSTLSMHYVYKRTAGSSGIPGTWESTSEKVNSVIELQIRPYDGGGLSFINPAQKATKSVRFDGKSYPNVGPNVAPCSESSGHQVDERTLEITDKVKGKITDTQQIELSPTLDILTMTVHPVGQSKPNILVFDRE
jgi:hypothetical protein